jgi:beta-galactosidase
VEDEYLFGADILVAPLMEAGMTGRDVYLPPGQWIDYQSGKSFSGGWRKIEAGPIPVVMPSHNPPTPELLDACDKLGMLVMDETRMMDSSPEGLSQLERFIRRDRNHPCVFLWSLGNEEREQGSVRGKRIVSTMKRLVRKLDPTRPVTVGQNGGFSPDGVASVVDVIGFNYNERSVENLHKNFPKRPLIGTETASTVCTRGWYAGGDASKLSESAESRESSYVSAYDANRPRWASLTETWWKFYDERPFLAGGFAWTGFDYRGEPTPFGWPCVNSHFGILDMCGFPKDNFYYYKAWWGSEPVLHLFPHWNWEGKEGQDIDVWVHSNLDRVDLFLNGQSLGAQTVVKNTHLAWKVKYAPGTLEARGYKNNAMSLTVRRETVGPAAKIALRPDRARIDANGEDISMVTVEIQDAQGRVVPTAGNEVSFQVSGAGAPIGLCNGNPTDHEIDKSTRRKGFAGLAMAIVQAGKQPGDLRIEASSPGLAAASIVVVCQSAKPRPALA